MQKQKRKFFNKQKKFKIFFSDFAYFTLKKNAIFFQHAKKKRKFFFSTCKFEKKN